MLAVDRPATQYCSSNEKCCHVLLEMYTSQNKILSTPRRSYLVIVYYSIWNWTIRCVLSLELQICVRHFSFIHFRVVKVSIPAWSRDHIFGLGLGLMGARLEVSYHGGWLSNYLASDFNWKWSQNVRAFLVSNLAVFSFYMLLTDCHYYWMCWFYRIFIPALSI